MNTEKKPLHSLIPLEDFKALLGVDDREDKISRFCLVTATYAIEQFCKRRLLRKKHIDYHTSFLKKSISGLLIARKGTHFSTWIYKFYITGNLHIQLWSNV